MISFGLTRLGFDAFPAAGGPRRGPRRALSLGVGGEPGLRLQWVQGDAVEGSVTRAVEALARNLAAELLHRGIRVNVVSPGPTETPILAEAGLSEAGSAEMSLYVMARMRMGRLGKPEEVAAAVQFLLTGESSFIVGQRLAVDGGMSRL